MTHDRPFTPDGRVGHDSGSAPSRQASARLVGPAANSDTPLRPSPALVKRAWSRGGGTIVPAIGRFVNPRESFDAVPQMRPGGSAVGRRESAPLR
jgi:hypothetical protein